MCKTNYDFTQKYIGLQGLDIISTNENNGIFQVTAKSSQKFAVCPRCKKITQDIHDSRWQTISFEKYVFMLSHKNTVKNVSEIVDISEGKCQRIYNYHASVLLKTREPEPLKLLGIDDIARKKGHNYNTVIYNQETGNIVAIFTGRKKDDVINYLKGWSEEIRFKVEAVSMDMSRSYCQSILSCFPNAKPVVDRFHLAQNFHKCVDDARKHIQNHIRKYGNKEEVFKIRWALLKNVEDLKREEALWLILACNKYPVIERLHYIKEEFREFFKIQTKEHAIAFIEYFKDLVKEFDIPELKAFCKTLDNWLPYILNYYDYPISNGLTEGNNHKVKNIKRRGYGYRNEDNFNLRVKLEFECA